MRITTPACFLLAASTRGAEPVCQPRRREGLRANASMETDLLTAPSKQHNARSLASLTREFIDRGITWKPVERNSDDGITLSIAGKNQWQGHSVPPVRVDTTIDGSFSEVLAPYIDTTNIGGVYQNPKPMYLGVEALYREPAEVDVAGGAIDGYTMLWYSLHESPLAFLGPLEPVARRISGIGPLGDMVRTRVDRYPQDDEGDVMLSQLESVRDPEKLDRERAKVAAARTNTKATVYIDEPLGNEALAKLRAAGDLQMSGGNRDPGAG